MASRSDIEAGKSHITLYVKNSALVKGLNAIKTQFKDIGSSVMGFGSKLMGIGTAITGPLLAALHHFESTGSALHDMATRTGASVELLAQLGYAADQSGGSIEDVEAAIRKMSKQFDELGLSGKSVDEAVMTILERLAAIPDPAERAAKAMEIFGKSGTKMLGMLEGGIEGLRQLRQEAERLGAPTTAEATAADDLGDALGRLKTMASNAAFAIGGAITPIVGPALAAVERIGIGLLKWVRANGEIFRTALKIGAAITAVGAVVFTLGAAIFGLGVAFGIVSTVIGAIGTLLGMLLSVKGAIVAGVAAWLYFTDSGRAAVSAVTGYLKSLLDFAAVVGGGITDALVAGDIELAMKIAWLGIQIVWLDGVSKLEALWNEFVSTIKFSLAGAFLESYAVIETGWVNMLESMKLSWMAFIQWILNVWEPVNKTIQDAMIDILKGPLQLSDEEVKQWKAGAKGARDIENSKRNKDFDKNREAAEASAEEERKRIEDQRKRALDALGEDKDREKKSRESDKKELDDLRKELDKSRKEAADKRAGAPGSPRFPDFTAPGMESMGKGNIASFSASALAYVGGGSGSTKELLTRAAKSSEKILTLTEDFVTLADKTKVASEKTATEVGKMTEGMKVE